MQSDEELFKTTPQTTPQKRQQPRPRPNDNDNDNDDSPQTKKSKRFGTLGPIPATYEGASEADKTLLRMKDVEGSSWADINSAVREITGVQVGGSTLAVRYARIKANMQVFEKSDELILLQSKKDIEDRFDVEKWQKISEAIESKSGNRYSAAAVQKKFKEMAKRGNRSGVQAVE